MRRWFNGLLAFSICCLILLGSVPNAAGDINDTIQDIKGAVKTLKKELVSPYVLPALPYPYDALEPFIDTATMRVHHDKHHAAYVTNLNKALDKYPDLKGKPLTALLKSLDQVPEDIRKAVQNNGGGHFNHEMFWNSMKPKGGGAPTGAVATAINSTFGGFDQFKQAFETAGTGRFGSGWVWLVKTAQGKLDIMTTANQDTPLADGAIPLLGNDVWEHAYYLKYQNRRPEYLKAWWNVVNWPEVNKRFAGAR
jgi:superoxide dismutase, Fe-Mn family